MSVIFVDIEDKKNKAQDILSRLLKEVVLSSRHLEGILTGKSRKEIAYDLHLSENT